MGPNTTMALQGLTKRSARLHRTCIPHFFSSTSSGGDSPTTPSKELTSTSQSTTKGAMENSKLREAFSKLPIKKTTVKTTDAGGNTVPSGSSDKGRFEGNRSRGAMKDSRTSNGHFKPPPTPPRWGDNKGKDSGTTSSRPHRSHWDRKPNFAKTVLEPAAQGRLQKGHDSGIPKLAVRKQKSSTEKDEFPQRQDRVEAITLAQQLQTPDSSSSISSSSGATDGTTPTSTDSTPARPRILPRVEDIIAGRASLKSVVEQYSKQRLTSSPTTSDVSTEETQTFSTGKVISREALISLFQHPSKKSLNTHLSNEILPSGPKRSTNFLALHRKVSENAIKTGIDSWGEFLTSTQKEELIQEQQDIQQQLTKGSSGDVAQEYGFWPTEYKVYTLELPHSDSRRQPKPIAHPTNRISPPAEFVLAKRGEAKTNYEAFLFLQRIPHPVFHEEGTTKQVLGRFDQPTHRQAVSEYVASILGVDISQICPTSMTSAFVGFDSPEQAANVVLGYRSRQSSSPRDTKPNDSRLTLTHLQVQMVDPKMTANENKEEELVPVSTTQEMILQISNIPAGMKVGSLLRYLHGLDSSILPHDVLTKEHIQIVDPTTAWVRVRHPIPASSFVKIENHLRDKMIPNQALLLFPAQRSVVHSGYTGPARHYPVHRLGPNLIVRGDTPSLDFFRSHAMVLHLCNVSDHVSATDISKYFQKYCFESRDVVGSTEFVYDLEGHFTGRVYVGFDYLEEGLAAWKEIEASGQRIQLVADKCTSMVVGDSSTDIVDDGSFIRVRPVQEKDVKRGQKLAPRTYRSEEDLWRSLVDWEKYVDKKDIEYLESVGVGKHVLEEAFMATRHNNPTFGVEDWARQGEKLRNEKKPGQHFKQFVKLYIETLKEVATTREKPGMLFQGMFVPGEEMDLGIFDREDARLEKLKRRYE